MKTCSFNTYAKKAITRISIGLIFSLTPISSLFACVVMGWNEPMDFFSRSEVDVTVNSLGNNVVIGNCKKENAKKFLAIGLGPEFTSIDFFTGSSFNGSISELNCHVNNPYNVKIPSYELQSEFYKQKSDVIQKCFQIRVEEIPHLAGLKLPVNQEHCNIQKIDKFTALINLGLCFLPVSIRSNYSLSLELKPECANSQFLADNQIYFQEFKSQLAVFLTDDSTGTSINTDMIHDTNVTLRILPPSKLAPLSSNFGTSQPRWDTRYPVQVHPSSLLINHDISDSESEFSIELLVDNTCSKNSTDSNSLKPCNNQHPIGAEVKLFSQQIKAGQPIWKLKEVWYSGIVVPSQWTGLLPLSPYLISKYYFQENTRYRLEVNLSKPTEYYQVARSNFKQLLIRSNWLHPNMDITNSIPNVNLIPSLKAYDATIANVPTLPFSNQNMKIGHIDMSLFLRALRSFDSLNPNSYWPPYYTERCLTTSCDTNSSVNIKNSQELIYYEFTLNKGLQPSQLTIGKTSNIIKAYHFTDITPLSKECL